MAGTASPLMAPLLFGGDPSTMGDVYAQQLQLQRQQAIADALMQQSLQPVQLQPTRITPRVSPLAYAAKMAQVLLAGRMQGDLAQQQGQVMGRQMAGMAGMFGPAAAAPAPSPYAGAQTNMGTVAAAGGGAGPTQAAAAMPVAPPAPAASPQPGPMQIPGMDPQAAFRFYMTDPAGYFKALAEARAQTPEMKNARDPIIGSAVVGNLQTQNMTPVQRMLAARDALPPGSPDRAALDAAISKEGYIPPVDVKQGTTILDPRTGQPTFFSPKTADGITLDFADPLHPTAAAIPGYGPAAAGIEGATTGARTAATTANTPHTVTNPDGSQTTGLGSDLFGGGSPYTPGPGGHPVVAPPAQAAMDVDRRAILEHELAGATDPNDRAAIQRELARLPGGPRPPVAGAPAAGARTYTGPSLGAAEGAKNAQTELSTSWQAAQAASSQAQTNKALLSQMRSLADTAVTGSEADRRQYLVKLGAYVGIPGMDAKSSSSDLLNKFSAQLVAGLAQKGGMSTDAARELVLAGTPNAHMQPGAIKEAIDGLAARESMAQARAIALAPHAMARDPAAYQKAALQFDQTADPRLWQMAAMPPAQLAEFAKRLPPAEAAALARRYVAAKQAGWIQ